MWVHSESTATVFLFCYVIPPTTQWFLTFCLLLLLLPNMELVIELSNIELSIMSLRSFFLRCDSWLRAHQCVSIAMAASPHVQQSAVTTTVSSSVSSTSSSNFMRSFLHSLQLLVLFCDAGKKKKKVRWKKEVWERKMLFRIPLSWWCRKSITQLHLLIHQS